MCTLPLAISQMQTASPSTLTSLKFRKRIEFPLSLVSAVYFFSFFVLSMRLIGIWLMILLRLVDSSFGRNGFEYGDLPAGLNGENLNGNFKPGKSISMPFIKSSNILSRFRELSLSLNKGSKLLKNGSLNNLPEKSDRRVRFKWLPSSILVRSANGCNLVSGTLCVGEEKPYETNKYRDKKNPVLLTSPLIWIWIADLQLFDSIEKSKERKSKERKIEESKNRKKEKSKNRRIEK